MKTINFYRSAARIAGAAALLTSLLTPLMAAHGVPLSVEMGSSDSLRLGEPVTVTVEVKAGAEFSLATFRVAQPAGWQIVEGGYWVGALKAGQKMELQFRAVPLSEQPEPLQATVEAQGYGEVSTSLEAARLGGQHPENTVAEGPEIEVDSTPPITGKSGGERAATISFTATGRFVYADDHGVLRGVRNAKVQVLDQDPLGPEVCGEGSTDANGNFSINSRCGDIDIPFVSTDFPDVFVRIILDNNVVTVRDDALLAGAYTASTPVVNNFSGGAFNVGQRTITSNQRAFQAHNLIMRAQQFMAGVGESMPKVTVLWPADATYYTPVLGELRLTNSTPFSEEGDVFHEYGHHILFSKTDFVTIDYNNGMGDTGNCGPGEALLPLEGGHCLWLPEKGNISWVEGWPDFFASLLLATHNGTDGYEPTGKYDFETRRVLDDLTGFEDHIEGFVAAILWDLIDTPDDDQEETGAGRRDNANFTFADIWDVIKNFDPSSDLLHNHPQNIHEFWQGWRARNIETINLVSEVYREHNIVKPQPDLRVTALQNPPTALDRGVALTLNSTVTNSGDERANNLFFVRSRFHLVSNPNVSFAAGVRGVGENLLSGSANTAVTNITIPATATPGIYRLRVCADQSPARVPESNEDNNCRDATATTEIR